MTDTATDPAIVKDVLTSAPVDTRYVWNRWHPNRATLKGVMVEARVQARVLTSRFAPVEGKYLILSRARSGTTLLMSLLNDHPDVRCAGEVLNYYVRNPRRYLNQLALKQDRPIWGAKFLSHQMVQIHRMADPRGFLARLQADGFRFIHLHRESFDQALSLAVAQSSKKFHSDRGPSAGASRLTLDPENFVARLRWSDKLLAYERYSLGDVPHLSVSYDRQLAEPATRTAALSEVFSYIGAAPRPVETHLKKLIRTPPGETIENYDVICEALSQAGLAHHIPTEDRA